MEQRGKAFAYTCRCCRQEWNTLAFRYYGEQDWTPPAHDLLKQWKREAKRAEVETKIQIRNFLRQQYENQYRAIQGYSSRK